MKANTSTLSKGLKISAYALVILPLFHISPSALSNDRPNWARDYIGEAHFDLNEDKQLRELNQNARFANERLNEINSALTAKSDEVDKLRGKLKLSAAQIDKISKETIDALQRKAALQNKQATAEGKSDNLKDKLTLAKTTKEAQDGKVENISANLGKVQENLDSVKQECSAAPSAECEKKVANLTQRIEKITSNLNEAKELLALAQKELEGAQAAVLENNKNIGELKEKIAQIDKNNGERAAQVAQLEKEQKTLSNRIDIASTEARALEIEQRRRDQDFARVEANRNNYRNKLIERILEVNRIGARYGVVDGNRDGMELAQNVGMNEGDRDGSGDGFRDGTRDGMTRAYNIGYNQGDIDGAVRARVEGERDGVIQGTRQGNIDAAKVEGSAAGENRARNSDAASVGASAGQIDGMGRADRDGNRIGTQKGESQAINLHESKGLSYKEVSGEFAGAFSRNVPSFPRGATGRSYRDSDNQYGREVVRLAYSDGYRAEYRRSIRMEFERNIARVYDDAYDAGFSYQYDATFNQPYDSERNRGHGDGETNAFARDYQGIYNDFYTSMRTQFGSTPNRDSSEFRTTFTSVEGNTFSAIYEQIRSQAYSQSEATTYDQNIAEKTQQYRDARFASVDELYKKNAVLDFVSTQMIDGGTNAVAAKDGIVMPGETLFYNVTVKNFGDAPASNVTVTLENGAKIKLPSIPAKSQTTIKGAAKARAANASVGKRELISISINSTLTTTDKVESRHFANAGQGLIAQDSQTHTLDYPLALTNLRTNGVPVLGESVSLSVSVQNKSKRSHSGPIQIVLSDNASSEIISKGFSDIQKIESALQLSDAKLSSKDESNAYRNITVNAKLVQNGVTLGYLNAPLSTMIKAKFNDKASGPVVLVDSDSSARELLNVMSEFGGLSGAGVIDVSLKTQNASVLSSGLKGKTYILVGGGNVQNSVQTLLSKSSSSAIITIDGNERSAESILKTSLFKGSYRYSASFSGVGAVKMTSSNKIMNKSLSDDFVLIEGDLAQIHALTNLAESFKLTDESVLDRIASEVSVANIVSPNTKALQLLQVTNARMFNEIMRSNNAFEADIVESKHIREDKSTLLYKFAKIVDTSSKPSNNKVGLFVAAVDSYETLKAIVNDSTTGKPVDFRVNAYIFGSPVVWNYATESLNKAYKALKKVDSNITGRIRNAARKTSPINIDRAGNNSQFNNR